MKVITSIKGTLYTIVLVVVIATALLGLVACTENPSREPAGDDKGTSIEIISPQDGTTVAGDNVTVTVQVTGFNIVDKQGQANVPGEGHVHFYLDVAAPTTPGQPAVPTSGKWAHISGTTYTFVSVPAGTHTISAQLVNNDHTPVIPPKVYIITVNVSAQGAEGGGYIPGDNTTGPGGTGAEGYGY